jgi:hypothetical protein
VADADTDGRPGTFHSSEIAFVFDNAELCPRYCGGAADALALSHKIGAAWSKFSGWPWGGK